MAQGQNGKVALLWRGDREARRIAAAKNSRFGVIFEAWIEHSATVDEDGRYIQFGAIVAGVRNPKPKKWFTVDIRRDAL
jgi:hypothetical protein